MKKIRTFRDREEHKPLKKLKRTKNRPGKGMLEQPEGRYEYRYNQHQWDEDL